MSQPISVQDTISEKWSMKMCCFPRENLSSENFCRTFADVIKITSASLGCTSDKKRTPSPLGLRKPCIVI